MTPLAYVALAVWCALLTVSDVRERRLPNRSTGSGVLAVLGYALFTEQFTVALLGALLLSAPYLLVHLLAPAALGAGDVKLAVMLGAAAALGDARTWVWAAIGAPALTACLAVGVLAWRRASTAVRGGSPLTVPHGPAMCSATLLALLSATLDST
ncbi:prepilin peptidase [Nocardia abscessus]|uniref:Prepilin peptidase n=1 Tax=Nocardia abscessus TaxID=120957 RepID=A0ABS0C8H7_9NOCA|nr:A24 family peptidase [Nocardia abscessus]MBF6226680.1 prepilin peptidase [Nocardia abscessus]